MTFSALTVAVDTMTRFLLHAIAGAAESESTVYASSSSTASSSISYDDASRPRGGGVGRLAHEHAAARWASESSPDRRRWSARVSGDVPEVSRLFLRTAHVLRAESVLHWSRVLTAMAQLRASSVLRRYFHLMTTGSARTTAPRWGRSAAAAAAEEEEESRDGAVSRPLEAALNDPLYFFGALFAWLHQAMVEEDEFLALFDHRNMTRAELGEEEEEDNSNSSGCDEQDDDDDDDDADADKEEDEKDEGEKSAWRSPRDAEAAEKERLVHTRRGALRMTFAGLSKHIHTALEAVMQRTLILYPPTDQRVASAEVSRVTRAPSRPPALTPSRTDAPPVAPAGLRGLFSTQRLGRLLHTARHRAWQEVTGRPRHSSVHTTTTAAAAGVPHVSYENEEEEEEADTQHEEAGNEDDDHVRINGAEAEGVVGGHASVAPFRAARSRGEQEMRVAATLLPTLRDLETVIALRQLFDYYGYGTVQCMLGSDAALTVLLCRTAALKLHRVWTQRLAVLRRSMWNSTRGAVARATALRPLASAHEWAQRTTTGTTTRTTGCVNTGAITSESDVGAVRVIAHRPADEHTKEEGRVHADSSGGAVSEGGGAMLNPSSPPRRHFVVDFLLRYGGAEADRVERAAGATASRSEQQQCATARTLTRELAQLILPVSVEYAAALRTLDSVLREGARHAEVRVALRARRRQQQQQQQQTRHRTRSSVLHGLTTNKDAKEKGADALLGSDSAAATESENRVVEDGMSHAVWMLLWLLLRYPRALSQQTTLTRSLDDVCTAVMVLNTLGALTPVLQRHAGYIGTLTQGVRGRRQSWRTAADGAAVLAPADPNQHLRLKSAAAGRTYRDREAGEQSELQEEEAEEREEVEAAADVAHYVETCTARYLRRLTDSYTAAVVDACFPSRCAPTHATHASGGESEAVRASGGVWRAVATGRWKRCCESFIACTRVWPRRVDCFRSHCSTHWCASRSVWRCDVG